MIYQFADFELDEGRREIRLRGREIPVQPRVLDLLAYLISHRDRVVTKDELLEQLWPGTIVVDGALQRVVSLARSALQQGGKRDAIRTYARRGYRFCADVERNDDHEAAPLVPVTLAAARESLDAGEWDAAIAAFRLADADGPLNGADLERWAQALQWAGEPAAAYEPLERAVAAHLSQSDRQGAARAAVQLAQIYFERLELSVAKGWHRRTESFLDNEQRTREHGLMHCLSARFALFEGELETAQEHAEITREIGVELEDPDLEGLGLLYSGHALLSLGETDQGLDCQNEAAAAVLTGAITPWVGSLIYCGVIFACRNRADWSRAAQWTEQFRRWCDRNHLSAFPGTCRLHRAEVLGINGQFDEAEEEISESRATLANWAPWAEGDVYRVLGDLHLAKGELDHAEDAYRKARELGWDPQPGHAMVLLARGRADVAVRALETSLADRNWANRERRGLLLSHLVIAAIAANRNDRARAALDELATRPDLWSTPALEAHVRSARAEINRHGGDRASAVAELKEALKLWREIGSPLNVARLQMRIGEILIELGEREEAEIELNAAAVAFEAAGANLPAQRCRGLLSPDSDTE